MNRFFLVTLLITACSCSHAPVGSAQHDLQVIQDSYDKAREAELVYDALPLCIRSVEKTGWESKCSDPILVDIIRTAGFNAEAALTIAEGERTNPAISEAKIKVTVYSGTMPQ